MPSPELNRRHRVDEVELAWDRWGEGDGPELALVHGYSGCAHDFALHIPVLAEDRPVLALDHRGHGRSSKLHRAEGYTLQRLAADLADWLGETATGPVDLLGHSMGGYLVQRVAVEHPELVRSLILMDTTGWSFQARDPELAELLVAFLSGYDPADGLPDTSGLPSPEAALVLEATPSDWRDRREELAATFDPWALQALGLELFAAVVPDAKAQLAEVKVPVTVVVGSRDHPFVDQAEELAGVFPDGRLVVIEGGYHSPQLTHPAEWLAAVGGHLDRSAR